MSADVYDWSRGATKLDAPEREDMQQVLLLLGRLQGDMEESIRQREFIIENDMIEPSEKQN